MKRLITSILFVFFASCFSYGANKMSMVTYFPVPYVAYSQVNVEQQLDVGLTNTCTMNLGCRESGTNLNANKVNLKSGKLELNQGKGVLGDTVTLGSGFGNGQIQFSNVRIQGGDIQSLNAQEMNVKELKLFGHKFPPCRGKGGSDGQMHWTPLSLKGAGTEKEELYLVCGNVTPSTDPDPEPSVECTDKFDNECINPSSISGDTWHGYYPCTGDSSFVGTCYYLGACTKSEGVALLEYSTVSNCTTHRDNKEGTCGSKPYLSDFNLTQYTQNATELCNAWCSRTDWAQTGNCHLNGEANSCDFYGINSNNSCLHYTLTCRSGVDENKKGVYLRTCTKKS